MRRARDTKLNRDVAIKVLPDAFANDSERLARFQREAQVLAALNHPNIAHIHGLEEAAIDGPAEAGRHRALVMELVEGADLSQRIARAAIPLDEALPIAKQIAEALEAAHEQGIIHRDLKPANIKVRPDGTVKVLDFGLAKLADVGRVLPSGPAGSQEQDPAYGLSMSPTVATTERGGALDVGTPQKLFSPHTQGFVINQPHNVEVAAGGQKFLVNAIVGDSDNVPIGMTLNWMTGLRK